MGSDDCFFFLFFLGVCIPRCSQNHQRKRYLKKKEKGQEVRDRNDFLLQMLISRQFFVLVKNLPKVSVSAWRHSSTYVNADCVGCGSALKDIKPNKDVDLFFPCICGAIQPVNKNIPLFDIFGMPPSVTLDGNLLEQRYRNLQRLLHPDKFSQRSNHEKEISAENSALVNVAYQTLRRPLERVRYLLSLEGIKALNENSRSAPVDPMFLMEIM